MHLPTFADPDNLIIPPDPRPRPQGTSALAFLQAVYRDPEVPLGVRMRAASECLPFESPKLSVSTNLLPEDFSMRLERAIRRSRPALTHKHNGGGSAGKGDWIELGEAEAS